MFRATRYVFFSFLYSLLFVFCGFGTLYILIDYSLNIKHFISNSSSFAAMFAYFFSSYLMRFDFFLVLSLIFATLYTVVSLKKRFELLAFQAGGISLKRLFQPVFQIALFCTLLTIGFYQYVYPAIVKNVDDFQQNTLKKGTVVFTQPQARAIQLENGTTLLFTHTDSLNGNLKNVYIIPSLKECWFCKEYDPHSQLGYNVSKINKRDRDFEYDGKTLDSHDFSASLPSFSPASWSKRYHKGLPLSEIYDKMNSTKQTNVRTIHESNFTYKLSISFVGLLILPLILGYAKTFHRKESVSILFIASFSGFICLYMALISLKILGEEEFISTLYSFPIVLGILGSISLRSFVKL